jgi:hypothetical protein
MQQTPDQLKQHQTPAEATLSSQHGHGHTARLVHSQRRVQQQLSPRQLHRHSKRRARHQPPPMHRHRHLRQCSKHCRQGRTIAIVAPKTRTATTTPLNTTSIPKISYNNLASNPSSTTPIPACCAGPGMSPPWTPLARHASCYPVFWSKSGQQAGLP